MCIHIAFAYCMSESSQMTMITKCETATKPDIINRIILLDWKSLLGLKSATITGSPSQHT